MARLEEERRRLERRLLWADSRGDAARVEQLEEQLAAIEEALELPAEALEGCGRSADRRRRWGDEMSDAFGW